MELTNKQKRFVEEYLIDLNASQAAIRAGYSKKTAGEIGYENLKKPELQAAIQTAIKKRSERTEITAVKVLIELALVGFANAEDYFEWSNSGITIKDSAKLTPEQRAVVGEVSETVIQHGGSKRIKLHDKLKALEMIGRHLAMFTDKHQFTDGSVGVIALPENKPVGAPVDYATEDEKDEKTKSSTGNAHCRRHDTRRGKPY